ncbi:hypothetical protein G9A89_011570 [Geosiphon pyriformis]|nr:hypothetical protein G9A89_011570 [Geosiphon pyriformis]
MSCHQYLCGTTITGKEKKKKNLPGTLTKTGKPTTIRTNYQQPGNGKRIKKKKKKKEKEENSIPTSIHPTYMYTTPQSSYHYPKLICINCGKKLLLMGMWNDIPGQGGMCDKLCQYIILISNWIRKGMPIDAIWRQAVKCLNKCSHDNNEIWQMALAKIKEVTPKEIKTIKDNPPELIKLD